MYLFVVWPFALRLTAFFCFFFSYFLSDFSPCEKFPLFLRHLYGIGKSDSPLCKKVIPHLNKIDFLDIFG
jgi:hypothetical protein